MLPSLYGIRWNCFANDDVADGAVDVRWRKTGDLMRIEAMLQTCDLVRDERDGERETWVWMVMVQMQVTTSTAPSKLPHGSACAHR